jgi:hypothetical protein
VTSPLEVALRLARHQGADRTDAQSQHLNVEEQPHHSLFHRPATRDTTNLMLIDPMSQSSPAPFRFGAGTGGAGDESFNFQFNAGNDVGATFSPNLTTPRTKSPKTIISFIISPNMTSLRTPRPQMTSPTTTSLETISPDMTRPNTTSPTTTDTMTWVRNSFQKIYCNSNGKPNMPFDANFFKDSLVKQKPDRSSEIADAVHR